MKRSGWPIGVVLGMALVLLTGCGSDKASAISGTTQQQGVSVSGQSSVFAPPDVADIQFGVRVQDRTVAKARSGAAVAQQAIIDSLKANGVAADDISTLQFSIDPVCGSPSYTYGPQPPCPSSGPTVDRSYSVSNVLSARVRNVANAGKVIDDATAAGGDATIVRGVTFSILDQSKLQAQAREAALKDARERAEKIASVGGFRIGTPISVNEQFNGNSFYSPYVIAAPRTGPGDSSTPIESGANRVQVTIQVVYSIVK